MPTGPKAESNIPRGPAAMYGRVSFLLSTGGQADVIAATDVSLSPAGRKQAEAERQAQDG